MVNGKFGVVKVDLRGSEKWEVGRACSEIGLGDALRAQGEL